MARCHPGLPVRFSRRDQIFVAKRYRVQDVHVTRGFGNQSHSGRRGRVGSVSQEIENFVAQFREALSQKIVYVEAGPGRKGLRMCPDSDFAKGWIPMM